MSDSENDKKKQERWIGSWEDYGRSGGKLYLQIMMCSM